MQSTNQKIEIPKKGKIFSKNGCKNDGKNTPQKRKKNKPLKDIKNGEKSGKKSPFLDKLAQLTSDFTKVSDYQEVRCFIDDSQSGVVDGTKNDQNLRPLAASKYMTIRFVLMLKNACPGSALSKSYFNTFHCCHTYTVGVNRNLIAEHCKNRWCLKCNRIRTAVLRIGYLPQFQNMADAQFVTLTAQTVKKDKLPERIVFFEQCWRKIMKYKNQEGKRLGISLVGLRKAECTPRPDDKYHYHFHLVVDGLKNAEWVVSQWLRLMGGEALIGGQCIKKADEGSLAELFKYFTKISSKMTGKDGYIGTPQQLDWIFNCVRGKRVFQPFGGLKMISEDMTEKHIPYQLPNDLEGTDWSWHEQDWVSEYGELLTNFEPTEEQKKSFM
jgi:hypothetical protein